MKGQPSTSTLCTQPAPKTPSLIACNRRGFLPAAAAAPPAAVSAFLAAEAEAAVGRVSARRGVVDGISADRIAASFAAARPCAAHRVAAARAADDLAHEQHARVGESDGLPPLSAHCSVCSGSVLCGNFGSEQHQRFMLIGGVSSLALILERLATARGVATLIDPTVRTEAAAELSCRAHDLVAYAKSGRRKPLLVWELVHTVEGDVDIERIYEHGVPDLWGVYNYAMRTWIAGRPADARRIAAVAAATEPRHEVRQGLDDLLQRIAGGAMVSSMLEEFACTAAAPGAAPRQQPDLTVEDVLGEASRAAERHDRLRAADLRMQRAALEAALEAKRHTRAPKQHRRASSVSDVSRGGAVGTAAGGADVVADAGQGPPPDKSTRVEPMAGWSGGLPEVSPGRSPAPAGAGDMMDRFADFVPTADSGDRLRAPAAAPAAGRDAGLVPDDAVLHAMDYSALIVLIAQCRLPMTNITDAEASRRVLRAHRDGPSEDILMI